MKINENLLFRHGRKTGEARIAIKTTQRKHMRTGRAREKKKEKIAGEGLTGPPLMGKGRRPHVYEGRARARARARSKYPGLSKLAFFVI